MSHTFNADDGMRLDRRSVLQTGAALLAGATVAGTASASDEYGDVTVGQRETVDRANIHQFDTSTDEDSAQAVPDVWGETAHAAATADEAGDSVWSWAGTGYAFDVYGDQAETAQITVSGQYSASIDGSWNAAATGTIEAIVAEVVDEEQGFSLDPVNRTTVLDETAGFWPATYRDQSFSVTQTAELEPDTTYAVTLRARAEAESSGGTASADLFSYNEDESFQGYASWDAVRIGWL